MHRASPQDETETGEWSPSFLPPLSERLDKRGSQQSTQTNSDLWTGEMRPTLPEEDVTEYRIRLRTMANISLVLWPAFVVVDRLVTEIFPDVALSTLVITRMVGWVPICFAALALQRRWIVGFHGLKRMETFAYVWANATMGAMCLEVGGPTSPYSVGFLLVLMSRGYFLSEQWWISLRVNLALAALYPIILLVGAGVDPGTAAKFDRVGWAYFGVYNIFIATAVILMAVTSNSIWSLRRQLFEARALGRYRLRERLGRGGMGEVWRAHHPGLRRDVAIKIARVDRAADVRYRERFRREVLATTELNHPHCVRIFDCGTTEDGLVYYVMELLEGETLQDFVQKSGPLSPERAVTFLAQVTSAIAAAHSAGIIHRDIKPSNIFVTQPPEHEPVLKVLDFGIAKLDVESDIAVTRTGMMIGTAAYMSPEVVAGQAATPASDVYALGMVLYFMLTGSPAFTGPNQAAVLHDQLLSTAPLLTHLGVPVSEALERLAEACLEKDPTLRPRSGRHLLLKVSELPERV